MRVLEWVRGRAAQLRDDPGALAWMLLVACVYAGATFVRSQASDWGPDHMMSLASNLLVGRSDLTHEQLTTINDLVTIDGRTYQAMSLLPTIPYLPLVPFQVLWPFSRWIVSAVIGVVAGWLALPLARRYGPGGQATYWLAGFGAFGTLLFTLAIEGDFYYLAHLESMLLCFLLLIEWHDSRRPWVLGTLIGLALLARPTLGLVAIPFGLALLVPAVEAIRDYRRRMADRHLVPDRVAEAATLIAPGLAFALPIFACILITGWWDWVRFGSAAETGYDKAALFGSLGDGQTLKAAREQGLFAIAHLPYNLSLFLGGGYGIREAFPWLVPSNHGQSILLTMPALLIAVGASLRERANLVLWGAVLVSAVPVFLYYGGGGANTYGYRYAMDFVPFLMALVAVALRDRFGNLEKALIGLSICFVCYGYLWQIYK